MNMVEQEPVSAEAKLRVLYDGGCGLCVRSVKILHGLDFGGVLEYLDLEDDAQADRVPGVTRDQALAAMHVVDDDGELYRGFFAVRRLARTLPALWPLLPVFHAPLSKRIGPRVYDRVARRRTRGGCHLSVGEPSGGEWSRARRSGSGPEPR
jgi:predicted DCC family thiol-disulfide oxidoreductase YuxK